MATKEILVRNLATAPTSLRLSDEFDIRSIEQVLGGKDVIGPIRTTATSYLCLTTASADQRSTG